MVRVSLCLQLLLLVLVLKPSDVIPYQCSKLLGEITSSATGMTELLRENQARASQCLVSGYYIVDVTSLCYSHMHLTEHMKQAKKW
jgi:uncharacterized protein (UPF0333 family)